MRNTTNEQKIAAVMNRLNCSRKTAIDTIYMIDWMQEHEAELMETHKWYMEDTGDRKTPFNVFCYGMWPMCKKNYILKREAEGRIIQ